MKNQSPQHLDKKSEKILESSEDQDKRKLFLLLFTRELIRHSLKEPYEPEKIPARGFIKKIPKPKESIKSIVKKELSRDEEIETLEKLAPLIDVILPFCCLNPKIIMEGQSTDKEINIDDLDIQTLMELFSAIFTASGVSDQGDLERANLEKPPLQKPLQPSA